jgi:hypothetical protein
LPSFGGSDVSEQHDHQIDPEECNNRWDCPRMNSLILTFTKKAYEANISISEPRSPPIIRTVLVGKYDIL